MGRPLNKRYFGQATPSGIQVACEAWVDGDSQTRGGYIVRQEGSGSYTVTTPGGTSICWLVDNIVQPGQMRVQVVAEGFPGTFYARKITDREVYTWDNKYFPYWNTVNGQIVYGSPTIGSAWLAAYGDFTYDSDTVFGEGLVYDSHGNLIVGGAADNGANVLKLSPTGDIIWQKEFSSPSYTAECVGVDPSDNIYVTISNNTAMVKMDKDGNILWQTYVENMSNPRDIAVASDGSSAMTALNNIASDAMIVVRFNPDGSIAHMINVGDNSKRVNWISVAFSGTNLIVGTIFQVSGSSGETLTAFDSSGSVLWSKSRMLPISGQQDYYGGVMIDCDNTGNIYMQGIFSSVTGYYGAHFSKWDSSGSLLWQTMLGTNSESYYPYSMRVGPDGTIYSTGSNNNGLMFVKVLTDGTLSWQRELLSNTGFDYWYAWGTRDAAVYEDTFAMTGYHTPDNLNATYNFTTNLPTDGSTEGTYGAYTYQNINYAYSTAAWTDGGDDVMTINTASNASGESLLSVYDSQYSVQLTNFG